MSQSQSRNEVIPAQSNKDYEPISESVFFGPDDVTKSISLKILNDNLEPRMDRLKMFSIEVRPLEPANMTVCSVLSPGSVGVVIEDFSEDGS